MKKNRKSLIYGQERTVFFALSAPVLSVFLRTVRRFAAELPEARAKARV